MKKIITLFIIALSVSPVSPVSLVSAKMYKCKIKSRTIYQAKPCANDTKAFKLKHDISKEKQAAAVAKLNKELAEMAKRARLANELYNKERLIQAEENKASAIYNQARQAARQVRATQERNYIESQKRY